MFYCVQMNNSNFVKKEITYQLSRYKSYMYL